MSCFAYLLLFLTAIIRPAAPSMLTDKTEQASIREIAVDELRAGTVYAGPVPTLQAAKPDIQVHPSAYDPKATLLLHLKQPAHQVQLVVVNPVGQSARLLQASELKAGFYEITLESAYSGLYMARIVVDGTTYTRQLMR